MAQALLEREVLGAGDLEALLGPRPYASAELRNIDKFRGGFTPGADADAAAAPPPPPDGPGGQGIPALAAERAEPARNGRVVAS
jgi:AFG3 family protein